MRKFLFYFLSLFSAFLSYLERGIEGEREEEKILFSFFGWNAILTENKGLQWL